MFRYCTRRRRHRFWIHEYATQRIHVELIGLRLPPDRRVLVPRIDFDRGRRRPIAPAVVRIILRFYPPVINRVVVERHERRELRRLNFSRGRRIRERRRCIPFHLVRDRIEIRIKTLPAERRLLIRRQLAIGRLKQLGNGWFGVPFRHIDIIDPDLIPRNVVRIDEHRTTVFPFQHPVRTIRTRCIDRIGIQGPGRLSRHRDFFDTIDVESEEVLVGLGIRPGPERHIHVLPDAQAHFEARGFTQCMQGARPRTESAHVTFAHHIFDGPLVRPGTQIGELRVIARLEIFIDEVRGRRIDAFVRRNEVTNAALTIGRLRTILTDHALAACRATAIDVRFVLILRHVVAGGHTHRQTRIGATGIARAAHAIAIVDAGITKRTRIARHAAAIDIRFVLILDSVITCRHGRTCLRHPVAIHRAAIAVLRTRFANTAGSALRSAAIDVRFVLVLDSVITRRGRNTLGGIRIADIARAIAVHRTAFANIASRTGPAATIDIGFGAILRAVITRRCRFARLTRRIADIAHAIAIDCTDLADIAFVALRAATVDVRFVLILRAIATRRRARISTSNRRHSIVANFTVRCTIEQIDPLATPICIWRTTLNRIATTLRRPNGWTAMIARTPTPATAPTFPSSTSAATLIRRSGRRSRSITTTNGRRSPEDQHA